MRLLYLYWKKNLSHLRFEYIKWKILKNPTRCTNFYVIRINIWLFLIDRLFDRLTDYLTDYPTIWPTVQLINKYLSHLQFEYMKLKVLKNPTRCTNFYLIRINIKKVIRISLRILTYFSRFSCISHVFLTFSHVFLTFSHVFSRISHVFSRILTF